MAGKAFEMKDIRCFLAVAEAASMRRAATKMGSQQSVASRRIRTMEGALRVSLFERHRAEVRLTVAIVSVPVEVESALATLDFERTLVAEFTAAVATARLASANTDIREGQGVVVFPRIVPGSAEELTQPELIKSGVAMLDDMFGGGQESGTITLVIGQSGTGKSTMASLYATAALERGESVALFLFEERLETFFRRSEGLGMNLRPFHESGKLIIRDFNPNEISPGEFAQVVQGIVSTEKTRVVVIDSFTGYLNSLPNRDKAVRDIQSLLKYLARSGVLTMLIVAQHGLLGQNVGIDVDVSFLGDTVLLLRIAEHDGRLRRNITVVKKRHGPHDLDVHELFIRSSGISVVHYNPLPEA